MTSTRTLAAEFIGTALLLAAIVGSGIMGDRLGQGNVAIALLANAVATGAERLFPEFQCACPQAEIASSACQL